MRQFQKLVAELKGLVMHHQTGETLRPPSLMPQVEIDGVRIAYVQAGMENSEGAPPIVFIHGFGGFFMDWPRVMAPVARQTRVYALDLPGWGFSEPNRRAESMEDDARIVGAFLNKMNLQNAILCGISYGGGVAWAAAALGFSRIREIVLLNPMPPHPMRYMHSPLYRGIFVANQVKRVAILSHRFLSKSQYKMICRENLLNERLLDTFYLDLAYMVMKQPKMPLILNAHAVGARSVNWQEWENRLSGIQVPVTILQALEDRIFSLESALFLHRLIPTSELIQVPDCGHAMVFDQHRKVSDLLLRLVQPARERGAA